MPFPIQFVKSKEHFDIFADGINVAGNGAVLAVGGISLAAITSLAFKALGFNKVATTIATAIPVTIATFGVASAVLGAGFFIGISYLFINALTKR